jgi:hypothetical protein
MSTVKCDQCQQSIVVKEGQYRIVGVAREGGYGRVASVVNVYVHRACEAAWRAEHAPQAEPTLQPALL